MLILCLVLLTLCHLGDYASTRRAFAAGAIEANPLVRRLGLLPAKLLGVALTLTPVLVYGITGATLLYTLLVCLVYAWVIWHNLRVARGR
jgi:hypothetical protein